MSFNIAGKSLTLQETTILHLVNPADGSYMYADEDETKPLTIELFGRASRVHRNWLSGELKKNSANQKAKTKNADELLAENAKFFATMTKAISNFDLDGLVLDNKEAFATLYADQRVMWINEQVAEVLGDTQAFLAK
jgi:hypothetical protein